MIFALAAAVTISTSPALLPLEYRVAASTNVLVIEPVSDLVPPEYRDQRIVGLKVSSKGAQSRVLQEIRFEDAAEFWSGDKDWIQTSDFDFDGHQDLEIQSGGGGSGGTSSFIVRFDPKMERFLAAAEFPNPFADEEGKLFVTGWRWGACCGWSLESRFVPRRLEPISVRRVDYSLADGTDYVGAVKKLASAENLPPVVVTVEEADKRGKLRVVCRMAEPQDGARRVLLEGSEKKCPSEGERE